jgi:hypothetical protein
MPRIIRGLFLPLVLVVVLTVAAGRSAAQDCAAPPALYYAPTVSYYYTPPAVSYYTPPVAAVSYYAPPAVSYYAPPAVSYYAPPSVSYYAAPTVSYYTPAYPAATVTTRYGLFGRPRVSVTQYYAP